MRILATGSSGYIGSVLAPRLKSAGYDVREFDLRLGNDILDLAELRGAASGCDTIVHLAGVVGIAATDKDPAFSRAVNVDGTANVVSCGKKVIFTSVLAGYEAGGTIDEETPVTPKHEHFKQKLEAERAVLAAPENIVLRLGSVYGVSPSLRQDLFIHTLIREAVLRGKITLYQPKYMRPTANIADVARAICFFLSRNNVSGGIYNVVSANLTKESIATAIQQATGCGLNIVEETDIEDRNYRVSTKKLQSLGFVFRPNLTDAIRGVMRSL